METISLIDLLKQFWVRKAYIITVALLFLAFGIVYSFYLVTPEYKASTKMVLAQSTVAGQLDDATAITQADITRNRQLVATYTEIIKSSSVLKEVIKRTSIDISVSDLVGKVSVSTVTNADVINVSVTDEDPAKATKITNTLSAVFRERVLEIYKIENVVLLDEAIEPVSPYNINHIRNLALFLLVGVFISAAAIFLMFYFDTTIKDPREVEKRLGIRVLSVIPFYEEDKAKS